MKKRKKTDRRKRTAIQFLAGSVVQYQKRRGQRRGGPPTVGQVE